VYPASSSENWFISGTAAYWEILDDLPKIRSDIPDHYRQKMAELNDRYLYITAKEGTLVPKETSRRYPGYKNYQIPRIKGTFLLHQLHRLLGSETFGEAMAMVHEKYREKEMKTSDFISLFQKTADRSLKPFISQWLERDDIPAPEISSRFEIGPEGWQTILNIDQVNVPYHFLTTVKIETMDSSYYHLVEVRKSREIFTFRTPAKPSRLVFNVLNDVLLEKENYYTWSNFYDDFQNTVMVYGTTRQIEANHTLSKRYVTTLADRFTETLIPLFKDSEIPQEVLQTNNLIVLGHSSDNRLMKEILKKYHFSFAKNSFEWRGKEYNDPESGLFLAFPNP
jgi:hypothetical protein